MYAILCIVKNRKIIIVVSFSVIKLGLVLKLNNKTIILLNRAEYHLNQLIFASGIIVKYFDV